MAVLLLHTAAAQSVRVTMAQEPATSGEPMQADSSSIGDKFIGNFHDKVVALSDSGKDQDYPIVIFVKRADGDQDPLKVAKKNKDNLADKLLKVHDAKNISKGKHLSFVIADVSPKEILKIAAYDYVFRIGDGKTKAEPAMDIARSVTNAVNLPADGTGVKVGIIGSGIKNTASYPLGIFPEHPDLPVGSTKIVAQALCTEAGCQTTGDFDDPLNHETHIAGIIGGFGNEDFNFRGIAPGTTLINAKLQIDQFSNYDERSVIQALDFVYDQGAKVVNMSLSGACVNSTLMVPVDEAVDRGMFVVASTGNKGQTSPLVLSTVGSPACGYNAFAVGAINDFNTVARGNDALYAKSGTGPSPEQGLLKPQVVAPGELIKSTEWCYEANWLFAPAYSDIGFKDDGDRSQGILPTPTCYASPPFPPQTEVTGTSFAAPFATAAAALILNRVPAYTPVEITAALLIGADWNPRNVPVATTSTQFQNEGNDDQELNQYGFGYLNMGQSLDYVMSGKNIVKNSMVQGQTRDYVFTANTNDEVKVVLSWLEHPDGEIVDPTLVPISDLDFSITRPSGTIIADASSTNQNNEFAVFTADESGEYRITVSAPTVHSFVGVEKFALASTKPLDSGDIILGKTIHNTGWGAAFRCDVVSSSEVWCASGSGVKVWNPTTKTTTATMAGSVTFHAIECNGSYCFTLHKQALNVANLTMWDISTKTKENSTLFQASGGHTLGADLTMVGGDTLILESSSAWCLGGNGALHGICMVNGTSFAPSRFISSGSTHAASYVFALKSSEPSSTSNRTAVGFQDASGNRRIHVIDLSDPDGDFSGTQVCATAVRAFDDRRGDLAGNNWYIPDYIFGSWARIPVNTSDCSITWVFSIAGYGFPASVSLDSSTNQIHVAAYKDDGGNVEAVVDTYDVNTLAFLSNVDISGGSNDKIYETFWIAPLKELHVQQGARMVVLGNVAPSANAGTDRDIHADSDAVLDGRDSADPNNDPVSYSWTQDSGPSVTLINPNSALPSFSAPNVVNNTLLSFILTVTDGILQSSPDTVETVIVNHRPVANAGADKVVNSSATVVLKGVASADLDGSSLTYQWTQTAGPSVTLSSDAVASPTFTAPVVSSQTVLTFELEVDDGVYTSNPDTVNITINPPPTSFLSAQGTFNKSPAASTQLSRPVGDVSTGGWTTTPLWEKVDETPPSNSDYVQSPSGTSPQFELDLPNISDPENSSGHIIKIRARATTGSGAAENATLQIYQGATQKATSLPLTVSRTSFGTLTYTLTASEADSITDYNDLRVRIIVSKGSTEVVRVSWIEFETPAAPVTQSVTGLSFQPKALILYSTGQTSEGSTDSYRFSIGYSNGTSSRSVAVASDDTATSNAGRTFGTKVIQLLSSGTPTIAAEANLVSFDATGFTLKWTTNDANAAKIQYVALGGNAITKAAVASFAAQTTTGNQNVAVGFQPDMLMLMHAADTNESGSLMHGYVSYGFASGPSNTGAIAAASEDNRATMDTWRMQKSGRALIALTETNGAIDAEAQLNAMTSNGFTLNWANAPASADRIYYLALKGGSYSVGSMNKTTGVAPVTQNLASLAFQPSGLILTSTNDVASGSQAHNRLSFGASNGAASGGIWAGDSDNTADGVTARSITSSKIIRLATEAATGSSSTINAEANLQSFNSNGFTLNWTTNNAVATQIFYVAFG